ncbi:LCP family protein [[Clostridium] aminophilum]|uniref:Transcriptional attenuator, LytR family n=1 Tax=[Clostridium] aminophilum TaxID=1526 RepID=A0A1I6JUZ9_9FIRM|nr:LCP family protein [[Clostridium] aminophilum]SFR82360.1 transcriptional attenuator, LytR family [[Clostridium] aminophilum]
MNYDDDELQRMRARRQERRRISESTDRMSGSSRYSYGSDSRGRSGSSGKSYGTGSGYGSNGYRSGSSSYGSGRSGSTGAGNGRGYETGSHSAGSGRNPAWKTGGSSPAGNGRKKGDYSYHSRKKKKRRVWLIVIEVIVVLSLLIGAAAWYLYSRTFGSLQKLEFDESKVVNLDLTEEQVEEMQKGYFNMVAFGVDSRSEGGKLNVGKGTNSDVNMIVSANLETGEIRIVSLFRDTYLNISDKNSYNKFNAAYAMGGPEQAVKALNKNLDLNITQYATFNWSTVAQVINILGGVDVDLSEAEFSWINAFITETVKETKMGTTQLTHAGHVHLDGIQAVAYARIRYSDTDYARTERQRLVVQKCFEKAKKASWAQLNNIMVTVFPQLATNIEASDIIPLMRSINKFTIAGTQGFPAARGEKNIGTMDCVIPQTLEYNVQDLHKFLFGKDNYQVSKKVASISEHIAETTGLTKNAKLIYSVPTDKGITAQRFRQLMGYGSSSKKKEDIVEEDLNPAKKAVEEEEKKTGKLETDSEGNIIYPTDEDGNIVYPTKSDGSAVLPTNSKGKPYLATDESGKHVYPTDSSGNVIDPPEDLDEEDEDDDAQGPGNHTTAAKTSEAPTKSSHTEPTEKTTEAQTARPVENGPGGSVTDNSSNSGPGGSDDAQGPGAN